MSSPTDPIGLSIPPPRSGWDNGGSHCNEWPSLLFPIREKPPLFTWGGRSNERPSRGDDGTFNGKEEELRVTEGASTTLNDALLIKTSLVARLFHGGTGTNKFLFSC